MYLMEIFTRKERYVVRSESFSWLLDHFGCWLDSAWCQVYKGRLVEGLFYPSCLVLRSANYQGF